MKINKRIKLKRRFSEMEILAQSRRSFFHNNQGKRLSMVGGPSINPVRKSIVKALDVRATQTRLIVHYNRDMDSQRTIDSRHENYYEKYGLPKKPTYNPKGRRFNSDSSETDPDYDRKAFAKLSNELNSRLSIEYDPYQTKHPSKETAYFNSKVSPQGESHKKPNCFRSFMRKNLCCKYLCCCLFRIRSRKKKVIVDKQEHEHHDKRFSEQSGSSAGSNRSTGSDKSDNSEENLRVYSNAHLHVPFN